MAQQVHPRLLELERLAAAQKEQEEAPESPAAEVPQEPVVQGDATEAAAVIDTPVDGEVAPETTSVEDDFIRVPKSWKPRDILKLLADHPEWNNVLKSQTGLIVSREYRSKLTALETELAELRAKETQTALKAIPQEELGQRMLNPEFRRAYDQAQAINPETIRLQRDFRAAIDRSISTVENVVPQSFIKQLDDALKAGDYNEGLDPQGRVVPLTPLVAKAEFDGDLNTLALAVTVLPEDVTERYQQAFEAGHYNVRRNPNEEPVLDQYGQPIPVSRRESLVQMSQAMRRYHEHEVRAKRVEPVQVPERPASAPAPAQASAPKANPKLAAASPDLSSSGSGRVGAGITRAEYRALNPEQKLKQFPNGMPDFRD